MSHSHGGASLIWCKSVVNRSWFNIYAEHLSPSTAVNILPVICYMYQTVQFEFNTSFLFHPSAPFSCSIVTKIIYLDVNTVAVDSIYTFNWVHLPHDRVWGCVLCSVHNPEVCIRSIRGSVCAWTNFASLYIVWRQTRYWPTEVPYIYIYIELFSLA